MELREYWSIIRRRWWLPVSIMLVALVASTVVGVRGATAYKTDMRLAVSTIPTPDPNGALYYDPTYYSNLDSEYLADDMSEFMTSRAFADEVHRELASSSTPYDVDIDTIMSATRAKKTHRFIDITLTTPTFEEGQAIAGSISRILEMFAAALDVFTRARDGVATGIRQQAEQHKKDEFDWVFHNMNPFARAVPSGGKLIISLITA